MNFFHTIFTPFSQPFSHHFHTIFTPFSHHFHKHFHTIFTQYSRTFSHHLHDHSRNHSHDDSHDHSHDHSHPFFHYPRTTYYQGRRHRQIHNNTHHENCNELHNRKEGLDSDLFINTTEVFGQD